MLLRDVLKEFKLDCQLRRLSPRTVKGYFNNTTLFLNYLENQWQIVELEAVRTQHIKLYAKSKVIGRVSP